MHDAEEEGVPRAPVVLDERRAQVHLGEEDGDGSNGDKKKKLWYLDSGANNHMTGEREAFSELDTGVVGTVKFGDGSRVEIRGRDTIVFKCQNGAHRALADVYFIPKLRSNIISIGQLDERGCKVLIDDGVLRVRDKDRHLLAKINRSANRLYKIDLRITRHVCLGAHGDDEAWLWHARFGQLSFDTLRNLACHGIVRDLPEIVHDGELCHSCLAGKQRRRPFPKTVTYRAEELLEFVHGDLCGPITPATHDGRCYFLLLVDDCSRYMWLQLLTSKAEAATAIRQFKARVETETGKKLKILRTDRGGEFTSIEFGVYCAEEGMQRHMTAPYSPQQNDVVERRNQTIVGMARSMLKAKGVLATFWGEAVSMAVFILNRSPTKSLKGKTPFEAWHGRKLDVSFLRTFGCVGHVKETRPGLAKLADRSTPMVLLGYEAGSKAYRFCDPCARRVCISCDVVFDEKKGWRWEERGDGEGSSESTTSSSFTIEHWVTREAEEVRGEGDPGAAAEAE
jgi:transposase InsO family protein